MSAGQRVRCAIYTRKSSEEGLEQDFNSLDAQREACAAYVLSQASEGWILLPEVYDDGGISGGTLQRLALQRLLADVRAGRIDTIVVYKVDRLTRALLDFSKLVEAFDAAGTSFVSVTQSFNTTTSMGRLTLNMLLSFAQFEREVTAERIRVKIAASKAKGMWMGGTPPLGYRADGRSLAIVDEHAAVVRHIFARYLVLGTVRLLADELMRDGIRIPHRTTASGKPLGGGWFSRGLLHVMLRRPTYNGQIAHLDKVFVGTHPAIIDHETWDAVQLRLAEHIQGNRREPRGVSASLLAGLIVDANGAPLIATHACKGKVRYRYYVSRDLHHNDTGSGIRIPALEIEIAVAQTIARAFDDPLALAATLGLAIHPTQIHSLMAEAADLAQLAAKRDRNTLRDLIAHVRILDGRIEIDLSTAAIAQRLRHEPDPDTASVMTLSANLRLTRTGHTIRLIQGDGGSISANTDPSLIALILKARRWWNALRTGEIDVTRLAEREGVTKSYVSRVVRLAFLAPAVIDGALSGTLRAGVGAAAFTATGAIDPSWVEQRREFLPG